MSGRVAVHTALTPRQRAELDARAQGRAVPRVRCPKLALFVQRVVRGRGAAGPYLSGRLHTLIRHSLMTAAAKEAAREALRAQPGEVIVLTPEEMRARLEADHGPDHADRR